MSTIDRVEQDCLRLLSRRMKDYVRTDLVGAPLKKESLESYTGAFQFSCTYLLHTFLKKWKGGTDDARCTDEAVRLWYEAERSCMATNLRLDSFGPRDSALITRIRNKILATIGSTPDWQVIEPLCKWGPGATFDVSRRRASAATKHTCETSVTPRCVPHLLAVFDYHWLRAQHSLEPRLKIVRGNRCVTVPKDATKHRMISCEPTGNSFLQSGVGRYFRRCLNRVGVDLNDQSVNQRLASVAQATGLATIDLSMASDTMSRAVVDFLLPPKWVQLLEDLRSPYSLLNDKWVRLEKFSSMGNGFTFELESLVFWAICSESSSTGKASVFGDDIVVPADSYNESVAALRFFGFTPNEEKSYAAGPYFESCGKHYYDGFEVTPVFQKEICDSLQELIRLHNRLFRWGQRNECMVLVLDALAHIRRVSEKQWGYAAKRGDLTVPHDLPGDFGFLSLKKSLSERKRYWVYAEVSSIKRAQVREEHGYYAFKMRSPTLHSNAFPDGRAGKVKSTRYVFQRRRFWHSSRELVSC